MKKYSIEISNEIDFSGCNEYEFYQWCKIENKFIDTMGREDPEYFYTKQDALDIIKDFILPRLKAEFPDDQQLTITIAENTYLDEQWECTESNEVYSKTIDLTKANQ